MKKILTFITLITAATSGLAASTSAPASGAINLAGTYTCSGYDSHDGGYKNAQATFTLDAKNSDFQNGYTSYHFLLNDNGTTYNGEAAANGNLVAIYFANSKAKQQSDQGVGIAVISHDKDTHGKVQTVLHKFYYEPAYQGGGNGSETCVKN